MRQWRVLFSFDCITDLDYAHVLPHKETVFYIRVTAFQQSFTLQVDLPDQNQETFREDRRRLIIKKAKLYYVFGTELDSVYQIKNYIGGSTLSLIFSRDYDGLDIFAEGEYYPFKTINFD